MYTVITYTEAKLKLSKILYRVSNGETFVITRNDQIIAKLVPVKLGSPKDLKQTVKQLRNLREGVRFTLDEIITWKNRGRT